MIGIPSILTTFRTPTQDPPRITPTHSNTKAPTQNHYIAPSHPSLPPQRLHAHASQATPHYFDKFAEPWMPTTADMLDELLYAALELEKPHLREQVRKVSVDEV